MYMKNSLQYDILTSNIPKIWCGYVPGVTILYQKSFVLR